MNLYTAEMARMEWIEKKVDGLRSEEKEKLGNVLTEIKKISEDQEDCSSHITVDNFGFSDSVRSILEYLGYNVGPCFINEYRVSWKG